MRWSQAGRRSPVNLDLDAAGTSPAALALHYDLPAEFFRLWLGPGLVYSCGLWDEGDPTDTLERAQHRKLDFFAGELHCRGRRVLDVGCGWGALAERFAVTHGASSVVALNLSASQVAFARRRGAPAVEFRLESWVDHEPAEPYGAITCVEATEHFASDRCSAQEKVEVYGRFFERCASWLEPDGRLGLQLICLDQVGHAGSRPRRGPLSELIRRDIFPESMPASLSEMVLGWETAFRLERFDAHPDHYRRTFRAWHEAARRGRAEAEALVGAGVYRTFARYFAAGEALFRLREQTLYRVILLRRERPKRWRAPLGPVEEPPACLEAGEAAGVRAGGPGSLGASPLAVRAHYDVSNDFYRLWLDQTMAYSSGIWSGGARTLEEAVRAKVAFFAGALLGDEPGGRVLDVGCGWGGPLRLLQAIRACEAVGLTISAAQAAHLAEHPIERTEIRLEGWADHTPPQPYDAVWSFGAFEHFARDGLGRDQRLAVYRSFFSRCFTWLRPGGHLGLETIAHDDAPETDTVQGRGSMADLVLGLFPESLAPHLWELVGGFEPWFEVEVLRSDPADFATTARSWLVGLRDRAEDARRIVGEETYRRFHRYLVATEMQFRLGELTNYRVVLRRRPALKR